jgi:hypothetical protein
MTTLFAGTFEVALDDAGRYVATFTSGRGVVGTMRVGSTLVSQILGLGITHRRSPRRRVVSRTVPSTARSRRKETHRCPR